MGLLPAVAILGRCLNVPVAERDSKRIMDQSHRLSLMLQQLNQGACTASSSTPTHQYFCKSRNKYISG
jgi:hypothetical protein